MKIAHAPRCNANRGGECNCDNDPLAALPPGRPFIHMTPKPDACKHDFRGWRTLADGNGGEQVCTKCGMGAMAYSLATGI